MSAAAIAAMLQCSAVRKSPPVTFFSDVVVCVCTFSILRFGKLMAKGCQDGGRGHESRAQFNAALFLNLMNRGHIDNDSIPQHQPDSGSGVSIPGFTYIEPELTKNGSARTGSGPRYTTVLPSMNPSDCPVMWECLDQLWRYWVLKEPPAVGEYVQDAAPANHPWLCGRKNGNYFEFATYEEVGMPTPLPPCPATPHPPTRHRCSLSQHHA